MLHAVIRGLDLLNAPFSWVQSVANKIRVQF